MRDASAWGDDHTEQGEIERTTMTMPGTSTSTGTSTGPGSGTHEGRWA